MSKGDYYFPLYYQRLLSSTIGWTDSEFGTYLRLLIYQFDNGFIPEDLQRLSRISPGVKRNWRTLSDKFISIGDGKLINPVMDEIYKEIQCKKLKNSTNGKKGGRPIKNPNETQTKPNGYVSVSENETQMKAIPITNNHNTKVDTVITVEEAATAEPVGSEKVKTIANEAWKDEIWKEQICMGLSLTVEELKKWLAMFNSSIASDTVANFDKSAYKKMCRGWIQKQKQKGTTVETGVSKTSSAPALTRL